MTEERHPASRQDLVPSRAPAKRSAAASRRREAVVLAEPAPEPDTTIAGLIDAAIEPNLNSLRLEIVPGWEAPELSGAQPDQVSAYIGKLEAYLAAGDQGMISFRLDALLAHWSAKERLDEDVEQAVAEDWLFSIGRYPLWAVVKACAEWLDTSSFKPHINNIRELCEKATHDYRVRLDVARRMQRRVTAPTLPRLPAR